MEEHTHGRLHPPKLPTCEMQRPKELTRNNWNYDSSRTGRQSNMVVQVGLTLKSWGRHQTRDCGIFLLIRRATNVRECVIEEFFNEGPWNDKRPLEETAKVKHELRCRHQDVRYSRTMRYLSNKLHTDSGTSLRKRCIFQAPILEEMSYSNPFTRLSIAFVKIKMI